MSVLYGTADSNYGINIFTVIICKINVLSVGHSPKLKYRVGAMQDNAIVGLLRS